MTVGDKRREEILRRINAALSPEEIEVIDESDHHIGHAGHLGGGRHFAVLMSASSLHGLSRVESHRRIYALFQDMMPDEIHALRIVLKKI